MENIEWLKPWEFIGEVAESAGFFEAELHRELASGHALFGVEVEAIARRGDCDDVLFALKHQAHALAVVHLTYSVEPNSEWPQTRLFLDREDWAENCMKPDNQDYWGDGSI